jgi:hypothetical protein
MISFIALLCAAGIAPADCTQANAIDVVAMGRAANALSCMQDSMMTLASLAIQRGRMSAGKWCVYLLAIGFRLWPVRATTQDQLSAPPPQRFADRHVPWLGRMAWKGIR